jgi:hypothetical protein
MYTDNGQKMHGVVMHELCKYLGVKKLATIPYRPSSNGITERDNATIKAMLSAFVNKRANDWDEHLPAVSMAYRSSVHKTLKETPFMMMMGRECRLPLDTLLGLPPEVEYETQSPSEYVQNLTEGMKAAHDVVSDYVGEKYKYQKTNYDRQVKPQTFEVGQAVWIRIYPHKKGESKSLKLYWDETWIVVKCMSQVAYLIQKTPHGDCRVMHSDRMKPHFGPITDAATKKLWLSLQKDADVVDRLAVGDRTRLFFAQLQQVPSDLPDLASS